MDAATTPPPPPPPPPPLLLLLLLLLLLPPLTEEATWLACPARDARSARKSCERYEGWLCAAIVLLSRATSSRSLSARMGIFSECV